MSSEITEITAEAPQCFSFSEFLNNTRASIEEWRKDPPHTLGLGILVATAFELVLAQRLFHGIGLSRSALPQFMNTLVFLAVLEVGFLLVCHRMASLFGKKGSWFTSLTFFHLGLAPLLLFLPLTLILWSAGVSAGIRLVVLLILVGKVLSNWKEVVQSTYKLTPLQITAVSGVLIAAAYVIVIASAMLSSLGLLADLLS
jgi:hypothetical protein